MKEYLGDLVPGCNLEMSQNMNVIVRESPVGTTLNPGGTSDTLPESPRHPP